MPPITPEVTPGGESPGGEWKSRRAVSVVIRVLIVLVPIAVSVVAGIVVGHLLPRPRWLPYRLLWWAVVFATSALAYWGTDRLVHRLLPLAALLELSLLFPGEVPRRLSVALRAGSVKHLPVLLEEAQRAGVENDPDRVAKAIVTLVGALSTHHKPTRRHSERVRAYTELIAGQLHLRAPDVHRLRWAALLHDIGKMKVPVDVLGSTGSLDSDEWERIRRHPIDGAQLIQPLGGFLGSWAATVKQHHERYDGRGYPDGLVGDGICLGGRIVAVADTFDAMTTRRSYGEARNAATARLELAGLSGRQFDPAIVRAFLEIPLGSLRWAYGPLSWVGDVLGVSRGVASPVIAALSDAAPPAAASALRAAIVGAAAVFAAGHAGALAPSQAAPQVLGFSETSASSGGGTPSASKPNLLTGGFGGGAQNRGGDGTAAQGAASPASPGTGTGPSGVAALPTGVLAPGNTGTLGPPASVVLPGNLPSTPVTNMALTLPGAPATPPSTPAPVLAAPCDNPNVVPVGGVTYSQCGSAWYTLAYGASGPVYVQSGPPPGS